MSKTKTRTRKTSLKWFAWGVLIIIGLATIFKLFEPIFVYNSGWVDLPQESRSPIVAELHDNAWQGAAVLAEKRLQISYKNLNAPALSVAISIEGKLVWRAAIGYANIKSRTPISYQNQFRLGSTSKAITAVAIGTLIDREQIQIDTMLGTLDPTLSNQLHSLTVGQVMSHRAGIRNYGACFCFPIWEHLNRRKFSSVRDSVSLIENDSFIHPPSERYAYTSLGYNLAGLAVEKASGLPFESLLSQNVFMPLGMDNSELEVSGKNNPKLVSLYQVEDGRYKTEFRVDNSIRWPSGGILSTPSDMVLLGNAMLDEQFLSKMTRSKLLTIPDNGHNDGGHIYAHGWRVSGWRIDDETVLKSYNHNGTGVGSTSVFAVFPEHEIVISVMMNKSTTEIGSLTDVANDIVSAFVK